MSPLSCRLDQVAKRLPTCDALQDLERRVATSQAAAGEAADACGALRQEAAAAEIAVAGAAARSTELDAAKKAAAARRVTWFPSLSPPLSPLSPLP